MSEEFSFLKGSIDTIMLCALYDKDGKSGDKYGYEIAKEIKEKTENKYEVKQATLYAQLKRLEQDGLIESYWGTVSNGGRRRYYKLTPLGRHTCERYMAEWEYHKNVLSNLVDSADTPIEVTQEEVTPLFSEKRKRNKPIRSAELQEQDEISRRLDELIGTTPAAETEPEPQPQEPLPQTYTAATVVRQEQPQEPQEDYRARFDVHQDDADDFLLQFDEKAREASENLGEPQQEHEENYQHVLLKVLGDQFDEMQQYAAENGEGAQKYYTDHPVALEDVAESLAKEGIRLRIYNHTSANYKSKTLMPHASILCKSAWITFAFAAVFFSVLLFTSITINNWKPYLITLAVLALAPVTLTAYALYDPSRKEKPNFSFKRFLIASGILAAIIILFAIGISIIAKIELSDYAAVGRQILIPAGIALLLPIYVLVYNYFYRKY